MTQIMCGSCKDGICLVDKTSCTRNCSDKYLEKAEALYNADYRKADEVRKETIKEIYLEIVQGMPEPIKEKWKEFFKNKYSIEVNG